MKRRKSIVDAEELAEIERELDDLEALLRVRPRKRQARTLPAAGGVVRTGRVLHNGLRPRPAAFAKAIADGLKPIPAAFQAGYHAPNRMTVWRLLRDQRVSVEIDRLRSETATNVAPGRMYAGRCVSAAALSGAAAPVPTKPMER